MTTTRKAAEIEGESMPLREEELPHGERRAHHPRDARGRRRLVALVALLLLLLVIVLVAARGDDGTSAATPPATVDEGHDEATTKATHQDDDGEAEEEHARISSYDDESSPLVSNLTVEDCTPDKITSLADEANCGTRYDVKVSNAPLRIAVINPAPGRRHRWRRITGCPVADSHHESSAKRGGCPLRPNCVFVHHDSLTTEVASEVDAVMMLPLDAHAVSTVAPRRGRKNQPRPGDRKPYRIIYDHDSITISRSVQNSFDLEMGIHYGAAAVVNPQFALSPHTFWYYGVATSRRLTSSSSSTTDGGKSPHRHTHFAISIIHNCKSQSRRRLYLEELSRLLGHQRLHLYGETCEGLATLPYPRDVKSLRELIARYKFHIVFEPVVQLGFVTSKFFVGHTYDSLLIYFGPQHHRPNMTMLSPHSYVAMNDFHSPKELVNRLLYLDSHDEEYEEHFKWREANNRHRGGRGSEEAFTAEYLDYVARFVPGPKELAAHGGNARLALCCRLCDVDLMREASITHGSHLVTEKLSDDVIMRKYLGGE